MSFQTEATKIRHINEGGMATVDEYYHPDLGHVAVKLLKDEMLQSSLESDLFLKEACRMFGIRHKHIVEIYKAIYFEERGTPQIVSRPAIVMQLINGPTLDDQLKHGPMSWAAESDYLTENVHIIASQVLDALDYTHTQIVGESILHLDIKPSNIMISWEKDTELDMDIAVIRVLDFGISQCQNSEEFLKGGTVDYMAPEQYPYSPFGKSELQPSTDLYAFAITLYELLIGTLPWSDENTDEEIYYQKMEGLIPNVCDINPSIPTHVGDVIMKALNPDPSKRFASAREMASALKQNVPQVVESQNPEVEFNVRGGSSTNKLLILLLLIAICGLIYFEQINF